jgi:hypothetical protein
MKSGCSALTNTGSQISGWPFTASSHQLSRPVCIATWLPERL